jgi:hypothetical protein
MYDILDLNFKLQRYSNAWTAFVYTGRASIYTPTVPTN